MIDWTSVVITLGVLGVIDSLFVLIFTKQAKELMSRLIRNKKTLIKVAVIELVISLIVIVSSFYYLVY